MPFCSRAIFRTFSLKSDRTARYGITVVSSWLEERGPLLETERTDGGMTFDL